MKALLGKCKWALFLSCFLFHCNLYSASNESKNVSELIYKIDKSTDRVTLFELIKKLKKEHNISTRITSYKRTSGTTTELGLYFSDKLNNEKSFNLSSQNGIADICIKIDSKKDELLTAGTCNPPIKEPTTQINQNTSTASNPTSTESTSIRTKQELKQQAARDRASIAREKKKAAILKRQEEMQERLQEQRIKKNELDSIAAAKKLNRLKKVETEKLERKKELEAARLDKINNDKELLKQQIEAIKNKNLIEQRRLDSIRKEREKLQRQSELRDQKIKETKETIAAIKESRKEAFRTEKERLQKEEEMRRELVQIKQDSAAIQRDQIAQLKLTQEEKLALIEEEKRKAQAIQNKLKEQELKKELERIQRERDLSEQALMEIDKSYEERMVGLEKLQELVVENKDEVVTQKVDENKIAHSEGTLIINGDQSFYRSYKNRTDIYNSLGKVILSLEKSITKNSHSGSINIKGQPIKWQLKNSILILKNNSGELVNPDGSIY
ncbi:hypothetical protein [Nonlabens tegetincola]|uniref:hypothetical protein n=1 Tax=Nonlabens tegetincola TaxID=323273 RepID=UPI0030C7E3F4